MTVFRTPKAFAAGAVFVASLVLGSHGSEESHGRALQASSNIIFINAVAGTAFTSTEEDAEQLQVCLRVKVYSSIEHTSRAIV